MGFDFLLVRFLARWRGKLSLSGVFAFLGWWFERCEGCFESADGGLDDDDDISITSGTEGRVL